MAWRYLNVAYLRVDTFEVTYISLMASKDLGLDLISTQVGQQVYMELGVRICVSVPHVDEPHRHREIQVRHRVLHPKHLEVCGFMVAEVDDHPVQLEQAHHLQCKLLVQKSGLIPHRRDLSSPASTSH